jgi:chromosome segregation ATPase
MDILKALKQQTDDFQKYRRYQARLTKIRSKKSSHDNVAPARALLAEINAHLKDMDARAKVYQAHIKSLKTPVVKAPGKLPLTN